MTQYTKLVGQGVSFYRRVSDVKMPCGAWLGTLAGRRWMKCLSVNHKTGPHTTLLRSHSAKYKTSQECETALKSKLEVFEVMVGLSRSPRCWPSLLLISLTKCLEGNLQVSFVPIRKLWGQFFQGDPLTRGRGVWVIPVITFTWLKISKVTSNSEWQSVLHYQG